MPSAASEQCLSIIQCCRCERHQAQSSKVVVTVVIGVSSYAIHCATATIRYVQIIANNLEIMDVQTPEEN